MFTSIKLSTYFATIASISLLLIASSPVFSATGTVDIRVIQIADDAEETTGVSTWIYDLELGDKLCGIRFQNVGIPKDATITNAYIQF